MTTNRSSQLPMAAIALAAGLVFFQWILVSNAQEPATAQPAGRAPSSAENPSTSEKWEYKIVPESKYVLSDDRKTFKAFPIDEAALNELGADGWELAGVVNKTIRSEIRMTTNIYLIFKRPKR